jgi:hypothetical protein
MEALELKFKHIKILIKKAYEWRSKVNKRHNRLDFFKTQHAIKRFRRYIKSHEDKFVPNKNEILLIIIWFLRCPPHNDDEKLIFILVSLIYKLHKAKLSNFNK